jgi:hypothetical protein
MSILKAHKEINLQFSTLMLLKLPNLSHKFKEELCQSLLDTVSNQDKSTLIILVKLSKKRQPYSSIKLELQYLNYQVNPRLMLTSTEHILKAMFLQLQSAQSVMLQMLINMQTLTEVQD